MQDLKFKTTEWRALLGLAAILILRMYGLFLVIPVISPYASSLTGASPWLVGMALGIYGLTQACLQIPLGYASDRFGRKRIISFGLVIFALGSLLASYAETLPMLVAGRALQGAGAISAAVMALLADLTRDSQRTKAMALLGISIGVAFMLALMSASWWQQRFGVAGMFDGAALFALLAIVLLFFAVPDQPLSSQSNQTEMKLTVLWQVFKRPELWRLNCSIFFLHAVLAMLFVAVPLIIEQEHSLTKSAEIWLYAPVLLSSFLLMMPLLLWAERRQQSKKAAQAAIVLLMLALLLLSAFAPYYNGLLAGLLLFFMGFNLLEALLPSWVSRVVPSDLKGTALGVYASCQFLGIFIGALLAGLMMQWFSLSAVFIVATALCLIWTSIAAGLPTPPSAKEKTQFEFLTLEEQIHGE